MTEEQMRVELAKLMQWDDVRKLDGDYEFTGYPPEYEKDARYEIAELTPNWLHKCVKTLTPNEVEKFTHILSLDILGLCPLAGDYFFCDEHDCFKMMTADAGQWAEALLKTKGLRHD